MSPTEANLNGAERLRAEIVAKIRHGTFRYAEYFPKSKRAQATLVEIPTFEQQSKRWLISISNLAFSTIDGYKKILNNHLAPLKPRPIDQIGYGDLGVLLGSVQWNTHKTRNNHISVIKGVFGFTMGDRIQGRRILEEDPSEQLEMIEHLADEPDPFDPDEAAAIIIKLLARYGERPACYFDYAFNSGLRPSELIALPWDNCDFRADAVLVDRAYVRKRTKDPKTYRKRLVDMNEASRGALTRMKKYSFMSETGLVFIDPVTNKQYNSDKPPRERYWTPTLKVLGIRYREPRQTRHSYASWLLMSGRSPYYVSKQLGHATTEMTEKVYARWIRRADAGREQQGYDAWLKRSEK